MQGSYIDVHDNENVYLSVDKAEVKLNDKVQQPKGETVTAKELASEKAMIYWKRLQEAGFVDADGQLLPTTSRKQAMCIAESFAEKMGIQSKWKTFERFWGISNLAQEKWDLLQTGITPPRSKEIDELFAT